MFFTVGKVVILLIRTEYYLASNSGACYCNTTITGAICLFCIVCVGMCYERTALTVMCCHGSVINITSSSTVRAFSVNVGMLLCLTYGVSALAILLLMLISNLFPLKLTLVSVICLTVGLFAVVANCLC